MAVRSYPALTTLEALEARHMLQRELVPQQVHDDPIIPLAIHHDRVAKPSGQLETEALIDAHRPPIVSIHLHFNAVKASKEEAVFANETSGLGAKAFTPMLALTNSDKQGGSHDTRDIVQTAGTDQLTGREQEHGKFDTVVPHSRLFVVELLTHLQGVCFPWAAYACGEFEVLVPTGERRNILLEHERQPHLVSFKEDWATILGSFSVSQRHGTP